jgi:hypothetical protein
VTDSLYDEMPGEPRAVSYRTQKEVLMGWLSEYNGPGYYGRANWNRSAEFVYNHFHNAPGLMWLAEAAGVPKFALVKAKSAVLSAAENPASQAAALRQVIPWPLVEALLKAR